VAASSSASTPGGRGRSSSGSSSRSGFYVASRARLVGWANRLLELGPKAAGGDQAAAAEMPLVAERVRRFGYGQLVVGAAILIAMVTARFS